MTESFPGVLPRRRSETTRLVQVLVRRAVSCDCAQSPSIGLLRGFDQPSRERAQLLRDQIRLSRYDIKVVIEPVALEKTLGSSSIHRCVTLDVTPHSVRVATLGFRWEPNQPEQGILAVSSGDLDVVLEPGTGLDVRPSGGELVVESIEDHHGIKTRLTTTRAPVNVYDRDTTHLLFRDEHYVGAAPARTRLFLDPTGVVRRSE